LIDQSRRRLLGGALALGLAPLAGAATSTSQRLQVSGRWVTGNRRLAPPSLIDGQVLFAGDATLGQLDPTRAQAPWSTPHALPGAAVFRPRGSGDRVITGSLGQLAAWQPGHDTAIWRHTANEQIGTPCLAGKHLYAGDGHELLAFDAASGNIRWRFAAIADTRISYAPAVANRTVFVGPGDGRLYALASADGQPRWVVERIAEWQYLRQLQVSGEVLVAGGYKEKLYGLDLADGRQRWAFSAGNFINSQHVADGVAYLWSPTGWLYAIDTASGAVRWRHRTTDYRGGSANWASVMAELVTADGKLYALDLANVLHVLAVESGEEIARVTLPEAVQPWVLPLAGGELLFGSRDGLLFAGRLINA
jgi:outer membrane protein assembly factor BamB